MVVYRFLVFCHLSFSTCNIKDLKDTREERMLNAVVSNRNCGNWMSWSWLMFISESVYCSSSSSIFVVLLRDHNGDELDIGWSVKSVSWNQWIRRKVRTSSPEDLLEYRYEGRWSMEEREAKLCVYMCVCVWSIMSIIIMCDLLVCDFVTGGSLVHSPGLAGFPSVWLQKNLL